MSPKNTRKVRDRSAESGHDKSFAEAYKKHSGEISILMGTFFLRYLGEVYRKFNGDLALVIVLGEIGHHNISACYSGQGAASQIDRKKTDDPAIWQQFHPCNAFSLSTATGIPRETVRRKIDSLVAKGWLRRNHKGEVFITESMVRHFHSDFDQVVLRELLAVAERVRSLIESKPKTAGESC